MANNWWREPDMGVLSAPVTSGEPQGCSAMRMWRNACNTLVAPDADDAWKQVVEASPPESLWHTLRNCVAYQAGVWQNLLNKGVDDVIQPAAFKLAIVLRHTPSELTVKLLSDLLRLHPQSQDLTSYILALLTDDEAQWSGGHCSSPSNVSSPPSEEEEEEHSSNSDGADSDGADQGHDTDGPDPGHDTDLDANEANGPADSASSAALSKPHMPPPDSTTHSSDNPNMPDSTTADDPIEVDPESGEGEDDGDAEAEAEGEGDEDADGEGDEDGEGEEDGESADEVEGIALGRGVSPAGPAPLRDLQLFGDCELAVLAASREEYDAHAKLVRAEYSKLTNDNYVQLRIKVLNQFSQIPKLFHSPEFECFESAARENIEREINTLQEHLVAGRRD
ncbi:unnamed protein product [Spodoptera littoralis]|uniref:Uncharacterized protein n=1 Tax=Spodoptera littoralis TaxID=7109 RepID=A0A9P0I985_SPOLI|nr:unnamed protein product [Spodoptera littoralis]CAH1641685.1 unnamed protein product [Spodoptera littoralis]